MVLHEMQTQVLHNHRVCLVGWLVGFLTSWSTKRLYRGQAPGLYVLLHMRQSWETMTIV